MGKKLVKLTDSPLLSQPCMNEIKFINSGIAGCKNRENCIIE